MASLRLLKELGRAVRQGLEIAKRAPTCTLDQAKAAATKPGRFVCSSSGIWVPEALKSAVEPKIPSGRFDRVMNWTEEMIVEKVERTGCLSFRLSLAVGGTIASGSALVYSFQELGSGQPFRQFVAAEDAVTEAVPRQASPQEAVSYKGLEPSLNYLQVKVLADSVSDEAMQKFFAGIETAVKSGNANKFASEICMIHLEMLKSSLLTPAQVVDVQVVFMDRVMTQLRAAMKTQ